MLKPALAGLLFVLSVAASAPATAGCSDLWDWLEKGCRRVADTWRDGNDELQFSGWAYHVPATWTPEKRAQLNENAWGGGYGRTVEDENGDTHTVYYLGFLDSHKNWQSNVGYAWSTYWGARDSVQVGLGYTVFVLQRPDIASGVPVPAILPLLNVRYGEFTLVASYVPTLGGGINHGSTLYMFGRYTLDTKWGR